jgi:hypothetical protein
MTTGALRGNEVPVAFYLHDVVQKVAPNIKVMGPQETVTRINAHGLAAEYTQMRAEAELSNIFSREILRKLGSAIGAHYAFQPRLAAFTQTMTDRWSVPAFDIRVSQTRSSILRLSLELWDMDSGALIWASSAEAIVSSEAVSQDPVFFEDAARVAVGSILADFLNGKTASQYTPLNRFLDQLIQLPEAFTHSEKGQE